jgi:hypothetical protein
MHKQKRACVKPLTTFGRDVQPLPFLLQLELHKNDVCGVEGTMMGCGNPQMRWRFLPGGNVQTLTIPQLFTPTNFIISF